MAAVEISSPSDEVGRDEGRRGQVKIDDTASHRHVEQQPPDAQDQRKLQHADDDVGNDFSEHQLGRAQWRVDQEFEIAALPFANQCDRRKQDHSHRQNDAHQTRNDVDRAAALRIVVGANLEKLPRADSRRRDVKAKRHAPQLIGDTENGRIGTVDQ